MPSRRGPSPKIIALIHNRMVTAGEDQLYEGIAQALPAAVSDQIGGGAALRLSSPVEFGRKFYQTKIRPGLHQGICVKANFCKNIKKYKTLAKITTLVAGAAADVVTTSCGLPPVAGRGAELVVDISATALKEGLAKLCQCG
jgi:hypothetical protein